MPGFNIVNTRTVSKEQREEGLSIYSKKLLGYSLTEEGAIRLLEDFKDHPHFYYLEVWKQVGAFCHPYSTPTRRIFQTYKLAKERNNIK